MLLRSEHGWCADPSCIVTIDHTVARDGIHLETECQHMGQGLQRQHRPVILHFAHATAQSSRARRQGMSGSLPDCFLAAGFLSQKPELHQQLKLAHLWQAAWAAQRESGLTCLLDWTWPSSGLPPPALFSSPCTLFSFQSAMCMQLDMVLCCR